MIRRVIEIDEEKCNGCGLCAHACHEGAIGMVDGKAKLLRDDYCDGLGNCLPACPAGAIRFVEREAAAFDEKAVQEAKRQREETENNKSHESAEKEGDFSMLRQWPVQIKLVPVQAAYFQGAHLLIAADCTAYAYGNFHKAFMKEKVTLIGCPKLDQGNYQEKLKEIIRQNEIQSVTVVRMEVPCCRGISHAAEEALKASKKRLPLQIVTLSLEGEIVEKSFIQ